MWWNVVWSQGEVGCVVCKKWCWAVVLVEYVWWATGRVIWCIVFIHHEGDNQSLPSLLSSRHNKSLYRIITTVPTNHHPFITLITPSPPSNHTTPTHHHNRESTLIVIFMKRCLLLAYSPLRLLQHITFNGAVNACNNHQMGSALALYWPYINAYSRTAAAYSLQYAATDTSVYNTHNIMYSIFFGWYNVWSEHCTYVSMIHTGDYKRACI